MTNAGRDDGFTLIELLIGIVMTGIILSSLTASFLVFYANGSYVSGRDDHSAGAEILASYLDADLASANSAPVIGSGTGCSTARTLFTLSWSEYQKGSLADSEPVAGTGSDTYKVVYQILPDTDYTARCAIKRLYYNPSTAATPSKTNVVARNIGSADFTATATGSCGAAAVGQTLYQYTLTLSPYQSGSTAADVGTYTYRGCVGARTNGI